jgi:DNA mismatch repair protein MutH
MDSPTLSNSEGTDWDLHRIRNTFNLVDAKAIAKIPLTTRRIEDFLAWQPEKSGMFLV